LIDLLIDQILSRSSKKSIYKIKNAKYFFHPKNRLCLTTKKTFKISNKIHSFLDKNKNFL